MRGSQDHLAANAVDTHVDRHQRGSLLEAVFNGQFLRFLILVEAIFLPLPTLRFAVNFCTGSNWGPPRAASLGLLRHLHHLHHLGGRSANAACRQRGDRDGLTPASNRSRSQSWQPSNPKEPGERV